MGVAGDWSQPGIHSADECHHHHLLGLPARYGKHHTIKPTDTLLGGFVFFCFFFLFLFFSFAVFPQSADHPVDRYPADPPSMVHAWFCSAV